MVGRQTCRDGETNVPVDESKRRGNDEREKGVEEKEDGDEREITDDDDDGEIPCVVKWVD